MNFIHTFLKDRAYQIRMRDTRRDMKFNQTGVPQGAVLSPSLFNMVKKNLDLNSEGMKRLYFPICAGDVPL